MPLKLLQRRYAMGITPLREALTVLSGTGLIVSDDSGRGFHVATASPADSQTSSSAAADLKPWRCGSPLAPRVTTGAEIMSAALRHDVEHVVGLLDRHIARPPTSCSPITTNGEETNPS